METHNFSKAPPSSESQDQNHPAPVHPVLTHQARQLSFEQHNLDMEKPHPEQGPGLPNVKMQETEEQKKEKHEKKMREKNMQELRDVKLKEAIPPVTGRAELLPPAYLNDPMRATSSLKRKLRGPVTDYKLVTSKRSRVRKIDLEAFLKDDEVWNSLTIDQQRKIADRSGLHYVTEVNPLPDGKLPNIWKLAEEREYMNLEDMVEDFQSDLKAGMLDPEYRVDAKRAGIRRARGAFVKHPVEESEASDTETSEDSSEDEPDNEDEMPDGENYEAKEGKNIPGKLMITVHED